MGLLTFKGGIHPNDGKSLAKDKAIVEVLPEGDLVFPLSQHIGAPAAPIVKVGDQVLKGQKIAEAGGFVSAPVYSSVSGKVKAIAPYFTPTGGKVSSIIVENDGAYTEAERLSTRPLEMLSKEEILNLIAEAGIVGMGGAGFPTHVKLAPKNPEAIDYILVNGAECEPYLTSDYRRMLEEPEKLVAGLQVILKIFPKAKGCICIEDNKPDCIRKMEECTKGDSRIEVKTLKTKYPQGAERMLIYAVTGRKINSSMLPADAGCIVDNVDTVVAISQAVLKGKPLMERIMTITGDAVKDPQNFQVPIGMLHQEVADAAGGFKNEPEKIISGGPMMGKALFTLNVPVIKTSSAILAMTEDEVAKNQPTACINCGRCAKVCPGQILPVRLAEFAEHGNEEKFLAYHGMECCECGCCSFVCPAKRQLTQSISSMRKIMLAKRKKG